MALTSKQNDVKWAMDNMAKADGWIIRKHKNPSGKICYRLIDNRVCPVINLGLEEVNAQIELGNIINNKDGTYSLSKNYGIKDSMYVNKIE